MRFLRPKTADHRVDRRSKGRHGLAGRIRQKRNDRLAAGEIKLENPGRCQVLHAVEAPVPFVLVQEPAVPHWLVPVHAVVMRRHRGHSRVGGPCDARFAGVGLKAERAVLVVERVVVPSGKKWADAQPRRTITLENLPGYNRHRRSVAQKHLVLDACPVAQAQHPPRPELDVEGLALDSIRGARHARCVPLRADRELTIRRDDPRINTVDEHEPPGRRVCRSQKERVVAASSQAGGRAGGKSTQAVRLQPLAALIQSE
jgi:hypothetical protein